MKMKKMKRFIVGLLCVVTLVGIPMQSVKAEEQTNMTAEQSEAAKQDQILTPSGMTTKEFESYCDNYFEEQVKGEIPGASIAVVSHGQIVFEKGYGYSDIANRKTSDPMSTVYEYGSVSKLFTWTSLMKLYEQGKVDLTSDIRQYLPADFKIPMSYDKPITILDLMNHQGGFGDYAIHLFNHKEDMLSLREALEEHRVKQLYEPGFASMYSNYGAALAGYIVENVVGIPEYEYVQNEIFRPIGMEHTILDPNIYAHEDILNNKAKVYDKAADGFKEENWTLVSMYPAGATNGTVDELAHFAVALLDEENHPLFESAETQKEMLSPSYQGAPGIAGIAHGFMEFDGEAKTYWHNGGTDHSSTFFAVVPEKDFGIAICTNYSEVDPIQDFGFSVLSKEKVEIQASGEKLPSTKEVEGNYMYLGEQYRGIVNLIVVPRYLMQIKVKKINEQQITINGGTYTQIEPYIYQSVDTGERKTFVVEDGKVIKYSYIVDYLKIPQGKIVLTWLEIIVCGLLVISLLITLVYIITLLVKKKFSKKQFILLVNPISWGAICLNYKVLFDRILDWKTLTALRPQMLLGCGIGIVIAVIDVLGLVQVFTGRSQNDSKVAKWLIIIQFVLSLLALISLASVSGFSLI